MFRAGVSLWVNKRSLFGLIRGFCWSFIWKVFLLMRLYLFSLGDAAVYLALMRKKSHKHQRLVVSNVSISVQLSTITQPVSFTYQTLLILEPWIYFTVRPVFYYFSYYLLMLHRNTLFFLLSGKSSLKYNSPMCRTGAQPSQLLRSSGLGWTVSYATLLPRLNLNLQPDFWSAARRLLVNTGGHSAALLPEARLTTWRNRRSAAVYLIEREAAEKCLLN